VAAAFDSARTAARGVTGLLRTGCTYNVAGPALSRLVEEFCAAYPDCELTLHMVEIRDPYAPLRRGEIDVLVHWQIVDEPDLTAGPVIDYRDRVLAVGRSHRFAAAESVAVEDLGDEEVHENASPFPDAVYDAIVPRFTPAGRPIRRTYPWRSDEDVLTAVARGQIVQPAMAGSPLFGRPDIVLVPITGLPPMPLGLIWCTAHENARIRALGSTAQRIAFARHGTRSRSSRQGTDQPSPPSGEPGVAGRA
jgi:DNA-binding transcriptional LysR family regulator